MVKNTRFTSGGYQNATLVILGWLCFIATAIVFEPVAKLPLLVIASAVG